MSMSKKGKEYFCNHYNPETAWGCQRVGDAEIKNEFNGRYSDTNEVETADIIDASGSEFLFIVNHYFTDLEQKYNEEYPNNDKMPGTLNIFVASSSIGMCEHVVTDGVNTHIDGNPNLNYKGSFLSTLSCDDSCNCSVICQDLTCEIKAKLSFSSITYLTNQKQYGYHNDYIEVEKVGSEDSCDY
eukprot:3641775-Ditylum_brightwellii.AAC.1